LPFPLVRSDRKLIDTPDFSLNPSLVIPRSARTQEHVGEKDMVVQSLVPGPLPSCRTFSG
jgi:hypothetical protein